MVVWFQYRILFKILGTKDYLKKVKLVTDSVCGLCSQTNETIEHLFCRCTKSLELRENVKQWILRKLNITFDFNESTMILGYLSIDNKFWPLNFILTMTRQYIYNCSKKGHCLNFKNISSINTKNRNHFSPLVCMRKDLTETGPSGVTCSMEYMIRCYDHQISNFITAS